MYGEYMPPQQLEHQISKRLYNDVFDNVREDIRFELEHPDPHNTSLTLEWDVLNEHAGELAEVVIEKPDSFFAYAHRGLREYMRDFNETEQLGVDEDIINNYRFRVVGLPKAQHRNVRDIWPTDINTLVSINCKIEKRTVVQPKIRRLAFICNSCRTTEMKASFADAINPPNKCDACDATSFTADYNHEENEWMPSQLLRIKEKVENLEGTKQPESMKAKMKNDICGNVEGGDDLTITGIVRADESGGTDEDTVSGMYIEVIGIDQDDKEFDEIDITDSDKKMLKEMVAEADDPFQMVKESIAPSIYGYENEKGALALVLFSGVPKRLPSGERIRGDIHMLLIGDPGVGKSQMLSYVYNVAPRAVQSSGKGSSAAGLTASAVQDDFGGGNQWSLEAGALVLADGGIAIIDEIDKMSSSDRSSIHEALEQQRVSVAKAGINSTLNTRCSLLAAANPSEGRWDQYEPLSQQIDLSPPLISRFDLIFTVEDKQSEEVDSNIAQHIISNHRVGAELNELSNGEPVSEIDLETSGANDVIDDEQREEVTANIDSETMRKYVALGRSMNPTLTDEASKFIEERYVEIRAGNSEDEEENRAVPITARKLEALVRLSEAVARMYLSETVEKKHAQIAYETVMATLEDVGIDPETGEFDANMIDGTSTKSDQDIRKLMIQMIQNRFDPDGDDPGVSKDQIMKDMKSAGNELTDDEFDEHMDIIMNGMGRAYQKPNNLFVPNDKY